MRLRILARVFLLMFGALCAGPHAFCDHPPAQELMWKNGQVLSGTFESATDRSVVWRSPLFEQPVTVDWSRVHQINTGTGRISNPDPFVIFTQEGSVFFGTPVSLSPEILVLESSRLGRLELRRETVRSLRRLGAIADTNPPASLIYSGPQGNHGWIPFPSSQPQNDSQAAQLEKSKPPASPATAGGMRPRPTATHAALQSGPLGEVIFPHWNRSALFPVALPSKVSVEIRLFSTHRLNFSLALAAESGRKMLLETWEETLVFTDGTHFQPLLRIPEEQRALTLRIFWDQETRACALYASDGTLLTKFQVAAEPSSPSPEDPGLLLENKGPRLTVDFLRIQRWNGATPGSLPSERLGTETRDGFFPGTVSTLRGGIILLQTDPAGAPTALELKNVQTLALNPPVLPACPPSSAGEFIFQDGSRLYATMAGVAEGHLRLLHPGLRETLTCPLSFLERLRMPPSGNDQLRDDETHSNHTLAIDAHHFRGKMDFSLGDMPRWKFPDSAAPVAPNRDCTFRVSDGAKSPERGDSLQSLAFTRGGDVVPAALESLDAHAARLQPIYSPALSVPHAALGGIQFFSKNGASFRGFRSGWQRLQGEPKYADGGDALLMPEGCVLWNPTAMQYDEIGFEMAASGVNGVLLRMHCDGTPTPCPDLQLLLDDRFGDKKNPSVYVILRRAAPGENGVQQEQHSQVLAKPTEAGEPFYRFKVLLAGSTLEVHVDDKKICSFGWKTRPDSMGLTIERSPHPQFLPASTSKEPVKIARFFAQKTSKKLTAPSIESEARTQALTIPRFRKEPLAKHVLVAHTGDLLRGELESATKSHFQFRAGLETVNVPRERVQTLLWTLPPPVPQSPEARREIALTRLALPLPPTPARRDLAHYLRAIQKAAPDLQLQLPPKTPGAANPQEQKSDVNKTQDPVLIPPVGGVLSIGDVLTHIGKALQLTHRIDEEGRVVLEPAATDSRETVVKRVYWPRGEFFPAHADARGFLASHGIDPGPHGEFVWAPELRQLTLLARESVHHKIRTLLESAQKPASTGPTHWFELNDGTVVALAVTRCSTKEITGEHPLFGTCTLPSERVLAISNMPPPPSILARFMTREWTLIHAREPIIPGADTSNSTEGIGKTAAPFTLPTLDGDQFSLGEHVGKVVVLDFWASWCGPCAKLTPELQEALSVFPKDKVLFLGVNQGEPIPIIERFMQNRDWHFSVALDPAETVGKQYGVRGMPHTVIIAPDGKVAWIKTGAQPGTAAEAAATVQKLVSPNRQSP